MPRRNQSEGTDLSALLSQQDDGSHNMSTMTDLPVRYSYQPSRGSVHWTIYPVIYLRVTQIQIGEVDHTSLTLTRCRSNETRQTPDAVTLGDIKLGRCTYG